MRDSAAGFESRWTRERGEGEKAFGSSRSGGGEERRATERETPGVPAAASAAAATASCSASRSASASLHASASSPPARASYGSSAQPSPRGTGGSERTMRRAAARSADWKPMKSGMRAVNDGRATKARGLDRSRGCASGYGVESQRRKRLDSSVCETVEGCTPGEGEECARGEDVQCSSCSGGQKCKPAKRVQPAMCAEGRRHFRGGGGQCVQPAGDLSSRGLGPHQSRAAGTACRRAGLARRLRAG
eukprot:3600544-Prymnesium_polylepis.1